MIKDTFFRWKCIVNCLLKKPSTIKEIEQYYQNRAEGNYDVDYRFSERNFLRDRKQMNEVLGINIICSYIDRSAYFFIDSDSIDRLKTESALGIPIKDIRHHDSSFFR